MKVCLVGDFSDNLDEGMKNVAYYLAQGLARNHRVLSLDLQHLFSRSFWEQTRKFAPQIIHYIPGPSILSLMIAKGLSAYCSGAKVVVSALHPYFPLYSWRAIPFFRPHLVLVQSRQTENLFSAMSCRTQFLPIGVDIDRFAPVSASLKTTLRRKYGLDKERFVILHVGHIKRGRNLQLLAAMQKADNQVIVVASTSTEMDQGIYQWLIERGCLIWRSFFPHLEEIYALSNCYVFPALDRIASIEWPLSVVEAMACNLPVICTRFGALPEVFDEGQGLIFAQQEDELLAAVEKIKQGLSVNTRDKVLCYSWENVTRSLEKAYKGIIV